MSSSITTESLTTSVRLAKIDDVSQVGDVLTHSFNNLNEWNLWIYPFLKMGVCEDLRHRLKHEDNYYCILAERHFSHSSSHHSQIVGTVELSLRTVYNWGGRKKYPYIANLAVSKNHRRQGVASQLLCKCEKIAKYLGFNELYLHVLANNNIGQHLYLSNGYTVVQVETDLYSLFIPSKRRLLLVKSI
ncbi:GNAT family N-acetyltransferase [Geminocystis sp. CENA526]|uniref:GNAT family N-acetyltransferase n=1 Tax=Geminocystis sp. CENA526 TaxID=1355871 RepID=UPI003D6FE426